MSNPWFRLYAEFATDPKVQMMSEALQRRFIMLLCMRCGNDNVTLHDNEIAFQLRVSEAEWGETKAVFIAKGFISEDNEIMHWEKRQYVSDSSAARVRKHRDKKRNEVKQARNVTVTPPDTDTDTDTDKQTSLRSVCLLDAQAQTGESFTTVPEDFAPTVAHRGLAVNLHLDLANEVGLFIAHNKSLAKTSADWDASFEGWLRRSRRHGGGKDQQRQASGSKAQFDPTEFVNRNRRGDSHGRDDAIDGTCKRVD